MLITDSLELHKSQRSIFIDDLLPSPKEIQKEQFRLSELFFSSEIEEAKITSVFPRISVMELRLVEVFLLINSIIDISKSQKKVKLSISNKNKWIIEALKNNDVDFSVEFHDFKDHYSNCFTSLPFKKDLIEKVKFKSLSFSAIFLLIIKYILSLFFNNKKLIDEGIWMSYANLRNDLDYVWLKSLNSYKSFSFIKNKKIPNNISFFDSRFRIRIKDFKPFISFRNNLLIINKFYQKLFYNKKNLDLSLINSFYKNRLLLIIYQNLFYSLVIEQILTRTLFKKIIYRGGNAPGNYYMTFLKKNIKYKAKSIFIPHGTELNPIDHSFFLYVDKYLIPSKHILNNWEKTYPSVVKNFEIISRPIYSLVSSKVKIVKDNNFTVGVILTYNTDEFNKEFINNLYNFFNNIFSEPISILIKQRPNVKSNINDILTTDIKVHEGDIYGFLEKVDVTICGVSKFGVLSMVFYDSIVCNIPSLFYVPQKFNYENLGYSYDDILSKYFFSNKDELKTIVKSLGNEFNVFTEGLINNQFTVKQILGDYNNSQKKLLNFLNNDL